jgi:hypothetical protein
MREHEARSIVRAFLNVFPDASLWEGGGLNWILLGRKGSGTKPSAAQFSRQWEVPHIAGELSRLGFESRDQLGATFLADAPALVRFVGNALPLTDAYPHRLSTDLRDRSPDSPIYSNFVNTAETRLRFEASSFIASLFPSEIQAGTRAQFRFQRILNYALYPPYRPGHAALVLDLREVLRSTSLQTLPAWLLGGSAQEFDIARQLDAAGVSSPDIDFQLTLIATVERTYTVANKRLQDSIRSEVHRGTLPARSELLLETLSGL